MDENKNTKADALDVERAWRDPEYLKSLTPEQLAALPPNPAGELKEADLAGVSGGVGEIVDLDAAASTDLVSSKSSTKGVSGSRS